MSHSQSWWLLQLRVSVPSTEQRIARLEADLHGTGKKTASTPRSSAMPRTVAPGLDSYKSTACRRNSSE